MVTRRNPLFCVDLHLNHYFIMSYILFFDFFYESFLEFLVFLKTRKFLVKFNDFRPIFHVENLIFYSRIFP